MRHVGCQALCWECLQMLTCRFKQVSSWLLVARGHLSRATSASPVCSGCSRFYYPPEKCIPDAQGLGGWAHWSIYSLKDE